MMITLLVYTVLYILGSLYSAQLSAIVVMGIFSLQIYLSALDEVGGRVERPYSDSKPSTSKGKDK